MLTRIAVLERVNAQLARENARLEVGEPLAEPVAATPTESRVAPRPRNDDSAVLYVLFALYVVMKVLHVVASL